MVLANCSNAELETQLEIAIRRGYAPERDLRHAQVLANQVSKMLYGLVASLERRRTSD